MELYGNKASRRWFIQLVDEHDRGLMESELAAALEMADTDDFCIAAVPVNSWNQDLTPWPADPVFGKEGFGDGAAATLARLLDEVMTEDREYYLCGYSLAGLFALWAATQTDRLAGVVAASPSVWYPGWMDFVREHPLRVNKAYLSLGTKEEKTRNPVMATVGDCIRELEQVLAGAGLTCQLDWNPGNHFVDSDRRTARGIAWMLENLNE